MTMTMTLHLDVLMVEVYVVVDDDERLLRVLVHHVGPGPLADQGHGVLPTQHVQGSTKVLSSAGVTKFKTLPPPLPYLLKS